MWTAVGGAVRTLLKQMDIPGQGQRPAAQNINTAIFLNKSELAIHIGSNLNAGRPHFSWSGSGRSTIILSILQNYSLLFPLFLLPFPQICSLYSWKGVVMVVVELKVLFAFQNGMAKACWSLKYFHRDKTATCLINTIYTYFRRL